MTELLPPTTSTPRLLWELDVWSQPLAKLWYSPQIVYRLTNLITCYSTASKHQKSLTWRHPARLSYRPGVKHASFVSLWLQENLWLIRTPKRISLDGRNLLLWLLFPSIEKKRKVCLHDLNRERLREEPWWSSIDYGVQFRIFGFSDQWWHWYRFSMSISTHHSRLKGCYKRPLQNATLARKVEYLYLESLFIMAFSCRRLVIAMEFIRPHHYNKATTNLIDHGMSRFSKILPYHESDAI